MCWGENVMCWGESAVLIEELLACCGIAVPSVLCK